MTLEDLRRRGAPSGRLGLGLAALGRPAYSTLGHALDFPEGRSPDQLEGRAHQVLDAAFAAGLRYVDAARSYGLAERFLRRWLEARGHRPGDQLIGSKWGYRYVGEWRLVADRHEVKDHSLAAFQSQLAESREALGPFLGLYQVHSVTVDGPLLGDQAVLDALAALRDQGPPVGLTVSGPGQAAALERALAVRRGGAPLFAAVQATFNLLDRSCDAVLQRAHDEGRLVIVKEPLANGRLTVRGDVGGDGPLGRLAASAGVGPDALALAFVLSRPWADLVLLGAATVDQLRANLAALATPAGAVEAAGHEVAAVEPADYWQHRAGLPWT
jgi:aryl-alcohol dehydrogenase-like predicted oxidoreductase